MYFAAPANRATRELRPSAPMTRRARYSLWSVVTPVTRDPSVSSPRTEVPMSTVAPA